MSSSQIVEHQTPEDQSTDPTGDQTDCQSTNRPEQREYTEDHPESPRPTPTVKKPHPGSEPDDAEEENDSTNDQTYRPKQRAHCCRVENRAENPIITRLAKSPTIPIRISKTANIVIPAGREGPCIIETVRSASLC